MIGRFLALAAVIGFGPLVLSGQKPGPPAIYTAAQAEMGRAAYRNTCALCHTASLKGRVGNPGENPPLSSLPDHLRKFVGNAGAKVPPLAGAAFMKHWEAKTTKDLYECVRNTLGALFSEKDAQTSLAITAYILQSNGARPGERDLTADTVVVLSALTVLQQNALVRKYCAVGHDDAHRNGGLSTLADHLKTCQRWSDQNRPTELAREHELVIRARDASVNGSAKTSKS